MSGVSENILRSQKTLMMDNRAIPEFKKSMIDVFIGAGAQSTLGSQDIFARKLCMKKN